MKRRTFLTPAAMLVAALAGVPAGAQDALNAATAVGTTGTLTVSGLATTSAWLVPIAGIVSGSPESVSFSGQARIASRLVADPDFGRPALLLTIDLSGVSGIGSSTKLLYVIDTLESLQRRVAPSHTVHVTFPFIKTTGATVVRSGEAMFALGFDVNTGAITSATGRVQAPAL